MVAATDRRDRLLETSSYGSTVALAAPGDEVVSTYAGDFPYAYLSGSSAAAPHVSAALAALFGLGLVSDPEHAAELLTSTVDPLPGLGCRTQSGGRLNLEHLFTTAYGLDGTPPAAVDDLSVFRVGPDRVVLRFTAPGDDGTSGRARAYAVRSAPSSAWIDFDTATSHCGGWRPSPAGTVEYLTVTGLTPEIEHTLQLAAFDDGGNRTLSNVVTIVTPKPEPAGTETVRFRDDVESGNRGWSTTGHWGITSRSAASGRRSWTDSPNGNYKKNTTSDLTSPVISIAGLDDVVLTFRHRYALASGDEALVQVSPAGADAWTTLATYTSARSCSGFQPVELPLGISGADAVRVRFRLVTDRMHQADGWYIDDITVRGKEEQRLDTVVFSESFDGGAGVVADLPWLVSGGRLADGLLGAPAPALAQARLAQPLDFSGLLRAELSFLLERALGTGELLLVEASTDGELWREVARYAGAAPAAHERVTLDAYAGQPRVFVRFVLATTSTPPSRRVAIDDLSVLGLPLPDACPDDPEKLEPGICGCGVADTDTDADGTADCLDACPEDAHKVEPGVCGCGVADEDTDGTGTTDCLEPDPEILVARNAVWRYLDDGSDVSAAFRVPSFDDGAWASGPAELGFGDGDEATVVSAGPTGARNIAVYFRHAFTVRNPAMIRTLVLELVRDDGAVVYLNGVEAFRTNMPSGPIDGTTLAVNAIAGAAESTPVVAELSPALLVPGRNVLAVQVHQNVASSSDLSFWLELRQISLDECPDDPDKMEPGVCGCGTPDVDEDANGTVDCLETCSPQFCDDGDPCTEESCDAAGACVHTWTCDGVPRGALWSYLDDGSALEPSWVTPEYDDSGWQRGFAELGYGDGDEATVVAEGPPGGPRAITTYFRKRFTVADRASITALRLDLVRDDGAVVYLNGTEVFRSNMPAGPVTASTLASSAIGGSAESAVVSTGVDPALLVDGENVLAVEIHQNAADSSDISFDLALVPVRGGPFDPEGVPLLAAGDIGDCNTTADTATGLLLDRHEGLIAVLGDVAYPSGSANDFANCFDPVWGRHRDRMRPVPGNHEYITPGASAYYAYFGDLAGDPQRGYYSYDLGEWHIVALNSNCTQIADDAAPPPAHGCAEGSTQLEWLRADLAANPRLCTLAYFHHPRFSSGRHGDEPMMSAIWDVLMEAGVDVVLSGHEHDYERTVPLTNQRTPGENGIPQFIVGTGGTALRTFAGAAPPTTVVRDSTTHGILELRLRPTDYSFRFIPIDGGTFTDSGTAACR